MLVAGVIGLGVGEAHARIYATSTECRLKTICDIDPARLKDISKKFPGATLTTDPAQLLNDPDITIVSIASFDADHAAQVVAALNAGKHVFVEKPLCVLESELETIRSTLRSNPRCQLQSNLILRCQPMFAKLKTMIEAGELGEIYSVEGDYWYGRVEKITEGWRAAQPGYSVMAGGGIHLIDLLQWLIGDKVSEVAGIANKFCTTQTNFRYDDCQTALLRFANGAHGKVSANFGCVHPHFHSLQIFGTKATFITRPEGGFLYRSRDSQVIPERIEGGYPDEGKGALLAQFVSKLSSGSPLGHAQETLQTMAVVFAIERSIRSRSWEMVR